MLQRIPQNTIAEVKEEVIPSYRFADGEPQ